MKIQYLLILAFLVSCQKEKTKTVISVTAPKNKIETAGIQNESLPKSDTIVISDGEDSKSKDYVTAVLLDQKIDKDSIITAKYQLVFCQNKIKTTSSPITIEGFQKDSEWTAVYGLSSIGVKSSPFIQINCGYPACGYSQSHYLYRLKENNLQLVYEWDTFSDSGYGSWVEFSNPNNDLDPKSIYCKTVAFSPTDDENEDYGTLKYSDSTIFQLIGNKWTQQLLSEKDKDYFEKRLSFDELAKRK